MQMSEFVTALLLSELAAQPVSDLSMPLLSSLVPILLLLCLEIAVPFLANKFPFFKKLVDGAPSIIINKGMLDQKEMSRLRLSVDELLAELRLKNIEDISQVEYAVLEQNGQLSVFKKDIFNTPSKGDLSIKESASGIAHPLIISGSFSNFNLRLTGKDRQWVRKKLGKRNIKNVLLFTVDDSDTVNIIMKYEEKQKE